MFPTQEEFQVQEARQVWSHHIHKVASPARGRLLIPEPSLSAVWPPLWHTMATITSHTHLVQLPFGGTIARLVPALLALLSHPYRVFSTWWPERTFQNIHQMIWFPCLHLPVASHCLRINSEPCIMAFQGPTGCNVYLCLWLHLLPLSPCAGHLDL